MLLASNDTPQVMVVQNFLEQNFEVEIKVDGQQLKGILVAEKVDTIPYNTSYVAITQPYIRTMNNQKLYRLKATGTDPIHNRICRFFRLVGGATASKTPSLDLPVLTRENPADQSETITLVKDTVPNGENGSYSVRYIFCRVDYDHYNGKGVISFSLD